MRSDRLRADGGQQPGRIDRIAPWPSNLNAPFCYKYGHNWEGRFFEECTRCGLTKSDIFMYGFLLAILSLPYYLVRDWYRERVGDSDA